MRWTLPPRAALGRGLWRLLFETAARAEEVLALDVPELDLRNRRAKVRRKGGAADIIVWRTATARLLPRLLDGRRSGPVFLTDPGTGAEHVSALQQAWPPSETSAIGPRELSLLRWGAWPNARRTSTRFSPCSHERPGRQPG
ncbi:MAG: hypothetical protein ACRDST_23180 [Pseudonocardiaceae bacterium]